MMVSARVCTEIGVGWTVNLDVLSCSLSLSLVVYDVQTCRNIVFIYSHIVYVDYRRKFRSLTSDNMDS